MTVRAAGGLTASADDPFERAVLVAPGRDLAGRKAPLVLDLGCGTGAKTAALAAGGARVVALDVDEARLRQARARGDGLPVVCADAAALPIRGGVVDVTLSVSTLQYAAAPGVVDECRRVLRPSGRAWFVENLAANPFVRAWRRARAWRGGALPRGADADLEPRRHLSWGDLGVLFVGWSEVQVRAHHLLAAAIAPFWVPVRRVPRRLDGVVAGIGRVDRALFDRVPGLRPRAWHVVVRADPVAPPDGTGGERSTRHVLVLNHAAVPADEPGGTRHVELFARLGPGWDHRIVASDRNLLSRRRRRVRTPTFRTVATAPYRESASLGRLLNWASYAAGATVVGVVGPRPEVVYASSPQPLALVAGLVVARLRRSPLVVEVRDLWPDYMVELGAVRRGGRLHTVLSWLEAALYRRAVVVVALTEGVAARVRERGATAVVVLPNGADLDAFDRLDDRAAARARWRSRLGLDPGAVVAVYLGNHSPAYGLDRLLDAAEAMEGEAPAVTFLLVGDGTAKAGLEQAARARGLAHVRFADPVPKDEVPALLAAADIGLHVLADVPLFRDGVSPNKLYDYFAAGLPVVTNNPGAVGDLVAGLGAGEAVAPDGLTAGVRRLVAAGPDGRGRAGAAGRGFLEAGHSRAAVAARLRALLDDLAP